jgi:hypothetical protein
MLILKSLAAAVVTAARLGGALRLTRQLAAVPPSRWRESVFLRMIVVAGLGSGQRSPFRCLWHDAAAPSRR